MCRMKRIGVVSDTHGTLHPDALSVLDGVDRIIHAGDIGVQEVIDRLETVAPVSAITGNVDWGSPVGRRYPKMLSFEEEGYRIFVKHIGDKPDRWFPRLPDPRPDVVIYGHSHVALCQRFEDVLFLNPGAAGRSRFGRPCSLAILTLDDGEAHADVRYLSHAS